MKKLSHIFRSGVYAENPVLVLMLGLYPALTVTVSLEAAFNMSVVATAVLIASNTMVSALRGAIPNGIRLPCYMALIAGMVTAADMLLRAHVPERAGSLGLYIPLVVANCVILARAEAFASKNGVLRSAADGLAMGLGFSAALVIVSAVREVLGNGSLFGYTLLPGFQPALIMLLPPGGLLVLGFAAAAVQKMRKTR
jgi:electron transport complex protein RnfE